MQSYNKAIQLDPNDVVSYIGRETAYVNLGELQQAIQDFDKALRLETGNAIAYANRGIAYGRMGLDAKADADKAMACWLDQQYC